MRTRGVLRENNVVIFEIIEAETESEIEDARRLFREYESWLGMSLCFQNFEEEVRDLPGKYVKPNGRLFLAYRDGELCGGVALRKLADGIGEMKRLFLRENSRGLGLGNALIERLIEVAREIGYLCVRLDTHPPKMGKAVDLYRSHGFIEIPPYYENPHDDVLFMEKRL